MTTADHAFVDASVRPIWPKRSRRHPQQEKAMEPITEALALLKRQAAIQNALRRSRDNPLLAERELLLIRHRLAQVPAAVQLITVTAAELQRPVDTLSARDVETRGGLPRPLTRDANTHTANPR